MFADWLNVISPVSFYLKLETEIIYKRYKQLFQICHSRRISFFDLAFFQRHTRRGRTSSCHLFLFAALFQSVLPLLLYWVYSKHDDFLYLGQIQLLLPWSHGCLGVLACVFPGERLRGLQVKRWDGGWYLEQGPSLHSPSEEQDLQLCRGQQGSRVLAASWLSLGRWKAGTLLGWTRSSLHWLQVQPPPHFPLRLLPAPLSCRELLFLLHPPLWGQLYFLCLFFFPIGTQFT